MELRCPKFVYFDLGMVLATFSVERMCRQVAEVSGLGLGRVHEVLFEGDLQSRYECGGLSTREFYDAFCQITGTRPDYQRLVEAASDIFDLHAPMLPIVADLAEAGYRLGVLSNTCPCHWEHCLARYAILRESFAVYALSYEIGASKPDERIFRRAAELAGVAPEEVFYTDDLPGHIRGALAAGFDAVQFTSPRQLADELRRRGVKLNY